MVWISVVTQLGRWWTTLNGPLAFQRDLVFSTSIDRTLSFLVWPSPLSPPIPISSTATDSLTRPQGPMSVWAPCPKVNWCWFWLLEFILSYLYSFFFLQFCVCRVLLHWTMYRIYFVVYCVTVTDQRKSVTRVFRIYWNHWTDSLA